MIRLRIVLPCFLAFALAACNSAYYAAMEQVGVHKREIMVDRVVAARDAQAAAKEQFLTAMERFRSVVAVDGGDLEAKYEDLAATLKQSETRAAAVRERIVAVEDVSEALFDEWQAEIGQYSSDSLRQSSQRKLDATQQKYTQLLKAMRKAESRLEPALVPLRDQVLFLKHNLNARAIAGLGDEVRSVQGNVDGLVREMEAAIAQADAFIATLRAQ